MSLKSVFSTCLLLFLSNSHSLHAEETNDDKSAKESKAKVVAIPFYDPSIEAGVSLVPIYSFYFDDNQSSPSTISSTLTYTKNTSYSAKFNADLLMDDYRIVTEFGFNNTVLTLFDFIETTQQDITFVGEFFIEPIHDLYLGLGLNYSSSRYMGDTPKDQTLLNAIGLTDEFVSDTGISVSALWDKREHYYFPYSGYMAKVSFEQHGDWLGNISDDTYSSFFTDYRHYFSLNERNNHILAGRWVNRYLLDAENAPTSAYTTYGRQGRDVQRGFTVGDYIASNMTSLELEYRYTPLDSGSELLNHITFVALAGAGKVYGEQVTGDAEMKEIIPGAPGNNNPSRGRQKADSYKSFTESDTLSMVGVGLRYRLMRQERINLRMDITYNNESEWLAYFSLGENI